MSEDLSSAEVDALRRRVLNVVGHELRTPVSALAGLARQLGRASEQEIRTEIGPALERLATRVEGLLSDLMLAAGITTALPVDRLTDVDLGDTAWMVWNSLGERASGCQLVTEGDVTMARTSDETASRILSHLLTNAAVYGQGPVTVITSNGDGVAVIEVRNNAPGLKPDEVRLAKEAMFRGELAVTRVPGAGVGLTVADALATAAGGSLVLDLTDGVLSARVELPAA